MSTWAYRTPLDSKVVPDEWVWERLRLRRNALLSECDWTQVADAPVNATAWAEYRQALRDLPANTTDPREAAWPDVPAV